ncbi:MAG TPA: hypothetical protein VGA86_08335 [Desulfatiglandales bacterium]
MFYDAAWLFFALGVAILISIGLLGIVFCPAIPHSIFRAMAVILSVLIIFTGVYLSFRWNSEKARIRTLTQQAEESIQRYNATHQKK